MRKETLSRYGLSVLFLIMGALMISHIINDVSNTPKYTKCYDKYNNEIVGQKCIDDGHSTKTQFNIFIALVLVGFGYIISIVPIEDFY